MFFFDTLTGTFTLSSDTYDSVTKTYDMTEGRTDLSHSYRYFDYSYAYNQGAASNVIDPTNIAVESSKTIPADGDGLYCLLASNIKRQDYSYANPSVSIKVNNVEVSKLTYTQTQTSWEHHHDSSRDYCLRARAYVAFINLVAGDVVSGNNIVIIKIC